MPSTLVFLIQTFPHLAQKICQDLLNSGNLKSVLALRATSCEVWQAINGFDLRLTSACMSRQRFAYLSENTCWKFQTLELFDDDIEWAQFVESLAPGTFISDL